MASAVATPVANGGDRRKSGRTSHRPPVFSQENHHGSVMDSAKRKRQSVVARNEDNEEDVASESEEDEEEDEGEPDEEELREKRRKQRSNKTTPKQPAAKRPKTTATASTTLAIRSANVPRKTVSKIAKQKARSRPSQFQTTGLYADVFGKGLDAESAATSWHNDLEGDHVAGIRDVVNLLLQVIGCESQIESSDVEDLDNVPGRLGDVLAEYDNQNESDYPLSGKQKQFHGMKEVFIDFFKAIVHALHNSKLLYEEPAIYDNLFIWIATTTGAGHRAFRITATLANLAMMTALTEAAVEIRTGIAASKQQFDAEKKKRSGNKGRIAKLQEEMARDEKRVAWIDAQLKDSFDTVFAHRYRDVDEKIRVECARALGEWILSYRLLFLEGQYLRYLGWVLSDPHAPTRSEVVRQLKLIYKPKTNVGALRGFTDRFRARLVEMGSRDADITVRVDTIELLDRLRSRELLEPEDIDTVGHLIFDNEPRVRKAVANFFVSNIEDLYEASVEDFDEAEFNEVLPDEQKVENYDQPTKLWIKFKCLAQTLGAHDKDLTSKRNRSLEFSGIENVESRYTVATLSIFDSMPELQHWEALAGCLLHDHSGDTGQADASNINNTVKETYRLEGSEEVILLDVLLNAVKLSLEQVVDSKLEEKNKRTKKSKDELRKQQESTAHNLSIIIPQLHNKFGSTPQAAKAILKLHQLFDPDLIDDVHEGDDDQAVLLDDVNKEFTTHSDAQVLAEASRALRAALAHENSKEAAEKKVSELWNELVLWTLSKLLTEVKASDRGVLEREQLQDLAEVTGRLSQLAKVKDCCEALEGRMQWIAHKSNRKRTETLLEVILQLVLRGQPDEDTPPEPAALEDQISRFAITILGFYFRWKVYGIKRGIKDSDDSVLSVETLTNLGSNKSAFTNALLPIIAARKPLDSVRVAAIKALTDLYALFATIRYDEPDDGELDAEVQNGIQNLITKIDINATAAIMETHEKMEKRLARKTKRRNLEFPMEKARRSKSNRGSTSRPGTANGHPNVEEEEQIDRPPEDSDDEDAAASDAGSDVSSSDGDDQEVEPEPSVNEDKGVSAKEAKQKAAFLAEKALCDITAKIVYIVLGDVVSDKDRIKKRLQINRGKLGKNYTQAVAYLDEKKEKASKGKGKGGRDSIAPKTPVKSATAAPAGTAVKGTGPGTAQASKKGAKQMLSEAMVLSDDDIEDDDDDNENEDEEGEQRGQGLEDDPIDEEDGDGQGRVGRDADVPDDDDEIMGD